MNHWALGYEVDATTASAQELKFESCSPLTSVNFTNFTLRTFICSRCLILGLRFGAKLVDLWMV